MPEWLIPLIPAAPLLACLITAMAGPRLLKQNSHWPCWLGVGVSFVLSLGLLISLITTSEPSSSIHVYDWLLIGLADSPDLHVPIALHIDSLTGIMLVTVTLVGMLVSVYSVGYMHNDPSYWRFFVWIALFIFSMTLLLLAGNFLLLYVAWELVGICSYLLIGFWYQKPEAAAAGKKAFLVNRVGDFGFALGVFLIWKTFGTLDYSFILDPGNLTETSQTTITLICLLLLAGAVGKSAQFPLHVWLPDAMEGPTPVSALIHAATMVTAGVYLVARCTPLFLLSPTAQMVILTVGGITALMAALTALTQNDLKRVLAYSTVSQLGYMFVGLGIGSQAAIVAGMFHLFTHAFFKALLFLGAGSVMHAMGGVIDMTRFSGLRHRMKVTHVTFAIGAATLAGFPLLSGFWSKDAILGALYTAAGANTGSLQYGCLILFWIMTFTAFLTAFYIFRAYFMTFWGPLSLPEEAGEHAHESPREMTTPLIVLAVASVFVGSLLGPTRLFHSWLSKSISDSLFDQNISSAHHWTPILLSIAAAFLGILVAGFMYGRKSLIPEKLARSMRVLHQISYHKFYLDEIYQALFVGPLQVMCWACRGADWILDSLVDCVARIPLGFGKLTSTMQNGLVQLYALWMIGVTALLLWVMIVLRG